jgi:hypothetical protein
VVFPNLAHRAAASVLRAAPTPHAVARLTPRRVVTLLKQAGRRNDAGLAENISTTLCAEALRQPGPVEHALGVAAIGLIETITAMSDAIAALKAELATLFDQHAQARSSTASPDSGRSWAPACLASLAMTRTGSPMLVGCEVSPGQPPSPARRGEVVWSRHAGSFFTRALDHGLSPIEVSTDRAAAYPRVLDELVPAACHVTEQYGNNSIEADHGRLKSRLRAMRGLKQLRCAQVITTGHAFIQNIRRSHYELGAEETVNLRVLAAFDELVMAI